MSLICTTAGTTIAVTAAAVMMMLLLLPHAPMAMATAAAAATGPEDVVHVGHNVVNSNEKDGRAKPAGRATFKKKRKLKTMEQRTRKMKKVTKVTKKSSKKASTATITTTEPRPMPMTSSCSDHPDSCQQCLNSNGNDNGNDNGNNNAYDGNCLWKVFIEYDTTDVGNTPIANTYGECVATTARTTTDKDECKVTDVFCTTTSTTSTTDQCTNVQYQIDTYIQEQENNDGSNSDTNNDEVEESEDCVYAPVSSQDEDDGVEIFDIQKYVDEKVNAGEKYIYLPTGKHYIEPNREDFGTHLRLFDLQDITIDGTAAGSTTELVCTKTTRAITLRNCTNVQLIGIVIDYDPLPYSQGRIVEMSPDKSVLKVEIMKGYPYDLDNPASSWDNSNKLEIYSPNTKELVTRTYFNVNIKSTQTPATTQSSSTCSGRFVSIRKQRNEAKWRNTESIGDIAVIGFRNVNKSIVHAVMIEDSVNTIFDSVSVFASTSFAFFEKGCTNSVYRNTIVDRRSPAPGTGLSYQRLRSSNVDCFHSKYSVKQGPSYIDCVARYAGDDGIAINGDYHIITQVVRTTSETTTVRIVPRQGEDPTQTLKVGDRVELVLYTGRRVDNIGNTIISVDVSTPRALQPFEKEFLQRQPFRGQVGPKTRQAQTTYDVKIRGVFTSDDLSLGSLISSAERQGNNFVIKNCTIGPLRSRGIVSKASNGVIKNNTIQDTWGHSIMLAPKYSWLESGSGNNIIIAENKISRSHDVAIAVFANGGNGFVAEAGAHNNVAIRNNVIQSSSLPGIAVTSTKELQLDSNGISESDNSLLLPNRFSSFGRNKDRTREIYLKNVIESNNR